MPIDTLNTKETASTAPKNTPAAAEYLGVSPKTLENWRVAGTGPVYLKINRRVAYLKEDLDAFLASCKRRSTSDTGPRHAA
ncbi:MAG: helix-turn-helix domain-containing protein [Rhizomicrobium sp.]